MNILTNQDMDVYLDHCKASGFNTVFFVFRPFQGVSDVAGNLPFIDDNITKANEVYWKRVDLLVRKAGPLKYSVEQCLLSSVKDCMRVIPGKATRELPSISGSSTGGQSHRDVLQGILWFNRLEGKDLVLLLET
jgi:hypothetical protein